MTNLLPDTASPRACELLNGLSDGDAPPRSFTEAGDYIHGFILGNRDAPLAQGLTCAVLVIRATEGRLEGEPLEEGQRVTIRCAARQLRDMTEKFAPAENDEIAILLHAAKPKGRKPFSYTVVKATPEKLETAW